VPTRRELLRRERARRDARIEALAEDGVEPDTVHTTVPIPSPSDLPSVDGPSTPVETSREDGADPRRPASRSGRRRAADRSVASTAELPESVTDLMFVLRTRPWLFLDVVDLAILTGRSRQEVFGGVELLAGRGMIRTATRGNRVCYAAAS
jgi:hypothetical protein